MKRKNKDPIVYKEEIYKKITPINLIIFGIYSILRRKEECTFEKIIEECFKLFPKVFCLSRYPKWPDSLKFDRSLRTLRERGLIVGNPNTLFTLTKFGENTARDTEKILRTGLFRKIKPVIERPARDAEINWLRNLKKSETFQRFLKEKKRFTMTNMELRSLLHCTLETPLRIVKQNLSYSINLAEQLKEKGLLKFLKLCQTKLNKK